MAKGDVACISKSLDGRITSWDGGAEKLFGYTAAEMLTKHIGILIPFDFQDEEYEMLDRLRTQDYPLGRETVRRRKDGSFFLVRLSAAPIRDEQGRIIGALKRVEYVQELATAALPEPQEKRAAG